MIKRLTICFCLAACGAPDAPQDSQARRIVSLDYCADQYVLALAEREDILALSPHAEDAYSYLREDAAGIPKVRAVAEDVLALNPDLIVRTYGGGPKATQFFEAAGVPVIQIGYAMSLSDVTGVLEDVAVSLQAEDKGASLIADFNQRLSAIPPSADPKNVLYMTSGGVTSGTGTLVGEMIEAAGLTNFETRPGWHALPLERLAREQPDLVATAFFEHNLTTMDTWSASSHPVAQRQLDTVPTVNLDSAWTSCGSWYLIEAIETLAEGAAKTSAAPRSSGDIS